MAIVNRRHGPEGPGAGDPGHARIARPSVGGARERPATGSVARSVGLAARPLPGLLAAAVTGAVLLGFSFEPARAATAAQECEELDALLDSPPLHEAAKEGRRDEVDRLLDGGTSPDQVDCDGRTALHEAAAAGHAGIVDRLLAAGADVDASSVAGSTALHGAALEGHAGIADRLLAAGADPNALRGNGVSVLRDAAFGGHPEIVERLIEAGADPDARDMNGMTPLHWAADEGHPGAVRRLLSGGADVDAVADDGDTPLHEAAEGGHTDVVGRLLAAGADTGVHNAGGESPLELAEARGNDAIVRRLGAGPTEEVVYREGSGRKRFVLDYGDQGGGGAAAAAAACPGVGVERTADGLVVALGEGVERHWVRNVRDFPDPDAAASRRADPEFRIEARIVPEGASGSHGVYWGASSDALSSLMDSLGGDDCPGDLYDYALFVIEDGRYRIGSVRRDEREDVAGGRVPGSWGSAGDRAGVLSVHQQDGRVAFRLDGELLHEADAAAMHGDGPGGALGVLLADGASVRIESFALETRGEPASLDAAERALEAAMSGGDASGYARALTHLRPLAERADDPHAQWRLAQMYAEGASVDQDYAKAGELLERAARAHHVPAQLMLAELLTRGPAELRDGERAIGVLREVVEADAGDWRDQRWYRNGRDAAAPQTRPDPRREHSIRLEAGYRIGLIHADGLGVEQDHREARRWFEQPAAAGHAGASYGLGLIYLDGLGVEADPSRAVELLEGAWAGGHVMASLALGMAHARDPSPVRDLERAYGWFTVASRVLPEGRRKLRSEKAVTSLAKVLSAEQRQRARELASRWIEEHR